MMGTMTLEWLWCDDHTKVTQWFLAQLRLTYKEFYASFINVANRAWELSRYQERAPLEGLQKFIVELLQKEHIPADELLTALQQYSAGLGEGRSRWKENGLVASKHGLSKFPPPILTPFSLSSAIVLHNLVEIRAVATESCYCNISLWELLVS
jgi:hypothetical protein